MTTGLVENVAQLEFERQLLDRSLAGDLEAFATLYQRYRPALLGRCVRLLRDRAAAEDVVQETFVRACLNLSSFDRTRRLWPWLATIAHRLALNVVRERRHTDLLEAGADVEPHDHASEDLRDHTVETASRNEARARLIEALRGLPPRQRRVLLLHAMEGWSYADIASEEHSTVSSVKSIIHRARERLRRSVGVGVLGAAVMPARLDAEKLRGAFHRLRAEIASFRARSSLAFLSSDGLAGGLQSFAAGVLALALAVLTTLPIAGTSAMDLALRSTSSTPVDAVPVSARDVGPSNEAPLEQTDEKPGTPPSVEEQARSLVKGVLDPTGSATPDKTLFMSIAGSTDPRDGTAIYAGGRVPCKRPPCHVLFRSTDGGASWTKLVALGLAGDRVLLPRRVSGTIFVMGEAGLQKSGDTGGSFAPASPAAGGAAVSPEFAAGDRRVLIGGASLLEYDDANGTTRPASLAAPAVARSSVVFSPGYARDGVVLVGGTRPDTGQLLQSTVYRCEGAMCEPSRLAGSIGPPEVRVSPSFDRNRLAYAFQTAGLYRSADGGRTFDRLQTPADRHGGITDLAVWHDDPDGAPTLFFSVSRGSDADAGVVFRSDDDGETWTELPVPVLGFKPGVWRISVFDVAGKPRLIAAGAEIGLACSDDRGESWSPRCPPLP